MFSNKFSEPPEEKYDPRSLYEKLQEQKNKRDVEYEEAHKLSEFKYIIIIIGYFVHMNSD